MPSEDYNKFTYTIKEPNENVRDAVIEKSGFMNTEFSIADIEKMQNDLSKTLREAKAKLEIEAAIVDNVERNHDYVKAMDDQTLYTVWMYWKAKDAARKCRELITELEQGLVDKHTEKEFIINKLGLNTSVLSPVQPVDPTK